MYASDLFVRALAGVRVNHITLDAREVRKERRIGAGAVIVCGNVYFRLAGALFRMFPTIGGWIGHETRMFRRIHGCEVRRDGRAIVMPRLPGRDLLTILREEPHAPSALVAAGRALAALHDAGLSHGDVNLGNFVVDGTRAAAIDFDAAHDPRDALELRAADDVLGMVLDLLRLEGDYERRLAHFLEGYGQGARVQGAFRLVTRPRGFLATSLLRARAHGATEAVVRRHVAITTSLLEGGRPCVYQ